MKTISYDGTSFGSASSQQNSLGGAGISNLFSPALISPKTGNNFGKNEI